MPDEALAAFLRQNAAGLGIRTHTRGPVCFAVPSMSFVYADWTFPFLIQLLRGEWQPHDAFMYKLDTLIAYARNDLVRGFLKTRCEYLAFVDNDTLPPQGWTTTLARHDKPVISALYHLKREPYNPVLYKGLEYKEDEGRWDYTPYEKLPPKGPVEVDGCGMGAVLIKRAVIEAIKPPWFKEEGGGEDFYFCREVQRAGYTIWADPEVQCLHIGTNAITTGHWLAFQEMAKQDLADKVQ